MQAPEQQLELWPPATSAPLIGLNDDTPRVRESDPLSSHQAADSNRNRAAVEEAVYRLLEHESMTDPELTARYFEDPSLPVTQFDSVRKRRSDLLGKGRVVATNVTRLTPSGRRAIVWGVAK